VAVSPSWRKISFPFASIAEALRLMSSEKEFA
jgi:hypothetical protein